MREIAVLGCSVPVFYPCRNFYGVAGMKLASLFSPFLIPTPAFGAEQELTAVRTIFAGRAAGLDGDTIRRRLRDTYV